MIQQKIFSALAPLVDGRCFYEVIPETNTKYPVIVYQFPVISPNSALCNGDLDDFHVQIDIYSPKAADVFALRKPVFEALENAFEYAERETDFTDYEHGTNLHRRVINYQIAYED